MNPAGESIAERQSMSKRDTDYCEDPARLIGGWLNVAANPVSSIESGPADLAQDDSDLRVGAPSTSTSCRFCNKVGVGKSAQASKVHSASAQFRSCSCTFARKTTVSVINQQQGAAVAFSLSTGRARGALFTTSSTGVSILPQKIMAVDSKSEETGDVDQEKNLTVTFPAFFIIRALDRIDARLDKMDSQFDRIDARLNKMDSQFDRIDARLDKMDS
ncbi:unnamed protein product [Calypogeia fissa]